MGGGERCLVVLSNDEGCFEDDGDALVECLF